MSAGLFFRSTPLPIVRKLCGAVLGKRDLHGLGAETFRASE
jgi:hypothetical protein